MDANVARIAREGHQVVHVARSGINRERYAAGVEELGIRVLAPDAERMRFLGFDFPVEWTFDELMQREQVRSGHSVPLVLDGISIPEHYMEESGDYRRKHLIAVLTDDQQGVREMQMASLTGYWADFERSYDFTRREFSVYRRADLVLTISEDDSRAFLRVAPELRTGRMPMIAAAGPPGDPLEARSGMLFPRTLIIPRTAMRWIGCSPISGRAFVRSFLPRNCYS